MLLDCIRFERIRALCDIKVFMMFEISKIVQD